MESCFVPAAQEAFGHFDLLLCLVDFWVVFLEPPHAQENVFLSKLCDVEPDKLRVTLVGHSEVDEAGDISS